VPQLIPAMEVGLTDISTLVTLKGTDCAGGWVVGFVVD